MSSKKTVFFLTGTFVNSTCWDKWKIHFEENGYTVHVPNWPYKNDTIQKLREKHPDTVLGALTLEELIVYYKEIIKKEKNKPMVIGHSLGGLIVQFLLQDNLVALGIAIHSIPPKGIFSYKFSFYKSLWKPFGFFKKKNTTHLMSLKEWQYAFTNGMSFYDQKESYEKYLIPESRRVLRDLLTVTAKIDFKKKKKPLLFIAGNKDHMMPASLNYLNFKKYGKTNSRTDYKEFEEVNHFVLGQKNWKIIAAYCMNWAEQNKLT